MTVTLQRAVQKLGTTCIFKHAAKQLALVMPVLGGQVHASEVVNQC